MRSTRSTLYRAARLLGDLQAASKGPAPLARRLARKQVHKATGRLARQITKGLEL